MSNTAANITNTSITQAVILDCLSAALPRKVREIGKAKMAPLVTPAMVEAIGRAAEAARPEGCVSSPRDLIHLLLERGEEVQWDEDDGYTVYFLPAKDKTYHSMRWWDGETPDQGFFEML